MEKLIPARQFRKQAPIQFCWLLRKYTNTPIISSIYNGKQKNDQELEFGPELYCKQIARQTKLRHHGVASLNFY